jgi:hypothetical protein
MSDYNRLILPALNIIESAESTLIYLKTRPEIEFEWAPVSFYRLAANIYAAKTKGLHNA